MTKNQRGLVVVGSILLIGGVVGYFLWKQKKDKEKPKEESKKDGEVTPAPQTEQKVTEVTQGLPTQLPTPIAPNAPQKPKPGSGIKVTTVDLLAGDIKSADAKAVYADLSNLWVYNMDNSKAFQTTKGNRIGTIINAKKIGGIYVLYIYGTGNVKYWLPANYTLTTM